MTLDEWMNPVVAGFPRPLQQHLRSEYRAHYQDHLSAGGSDDALALFGDPEETRRQLKKVYLTQEVLGIRSNLVPLLFGILIVLYAFLASRFVMFPKYTNSWSYLGLVLVPIGVAWIWKHTLKWVPERRQPFRANGLLALFGVLQGCNLLPLNGVMQQSQFCFAIVLTVFYSYNMFARDARVRRTLDPTGWHKA